MSTIVLLLFPKPVAIGLAPGALEAQNALALEMIEVRRQRLCDLSWFMKCLNEHIARRANLEDHCTGAFWDSFLLLLKLHTSHPCE